MMDLILLFFFFFFYLVHDRLVENMDPSREITTCSAYM